MKALKEKRVSLRSLFRRSLVILSLLALAFAVASCSSDSGGSDTEPTNGQTTPTNGSTEPTGPVAAKMVVGMTVLQHPYLPSYEGAAPDLTGLEVLVQWSDGDRQIVKDPSEFGVYPPIAFVTKEGSAESYSPYGRYGIQYREQDDIYNRDTYRVNVYIPMVVALDPTKTEKGLGNTYAVLGRDDEGKLITDTTLLSQTQKDNRKIVPRVVGKLGDVYEDVGVEAKAVKDVNYVGTYNTFNLGTLFGYKSANPISFPPDSNYKKIEDLMWFGVAEKDRVNSDGTPNIETLLDAWKPFPSSDLDPDTGNKEFKNPVSDNPEAWKLQDRVVGKDIMVTYKARSVVGLGDVVGAAVDVENVAIDRYFKVDRLKYVDGLKNITPIAADDKKYGGNNVRRAISGGRVITGYWPVEDQVMIDWWGKLYDAKLKFQVIYYLDKASGKDPSVTKTRDITMTEYVRAMHTVDENGTPKATLPMFTGYTVTGQYTNDTASRNLTPDAAYDGLFDPSSPQHWASTDGDYNLYITLFYYSDMIEPYDPISKKGGYGRGKPKTNADYWEGNGATIPLATDDVHKVALFSEFRNDKDKDRKDGTQHDGEPTIYNANVIKEEIKVGGLQTAYQVNRKSLYDQLFKYWDPKWVYENLDTDNPDEIALSIDDNLWWYPYSDRDNGVATGSTAGNPLTDTTWFGYVKSAIQDYDFDDIEEEEIRTCELQFPAPPSMGPSEDDTLEFDYYVKP